MPDEPGRNRTTTAATIAAADFRNWGIGALPVLDYPRPIAGAGAERGAERPGNPKEDRR